MDQPSRRRAPSSDRRTPTSSACRLRISASCERLSERCASSTIEISASNRLRSARSRAQRVARGIDAGLQVGFGGGRLLDVDERVGHFAERRLDRLLVARHGLLLRAPSSRPPRAFSRPAVKIGSDSANPIDQILPLLCTSELNDLALAAEIPGQRDRAGAARPWRRRSAALAETRFSSAARMSGRRSSSVEGRPGRRHRRHGNATKGRPARDCRSSLPVSVPSRCSASARCRVRSLSCAAASERAPSAWLRSRSEASPLSARRRTMPR